ncbi:DUF5313 family protein [Gordonia rubripertincta]|uniref:DUF5313 family protein n=1 Tax=Gordonia rubripertincta TaxID=36822 RepID=A0ABT4N3Q9_GORRU|nr:DUF5313 family protein [Gordonia rubripertincta]MCZ4553896.1 DUF5313 family protein [Gordonia rubripertincta]
MSTRSTPSPLQVVKYLLGRPLPVSMRDWVVRDVTGPGSRRRYIIRGVLPFVPILLAFALLVPGPFVYRIGMIALLLIPLVYFEIALMSIYRRHLLTSNGLDGSLIDVKRQARREVTRSEYEANYPRKPD